MANDPNTIQYVIQEDGFWYIASKDRTPGVPEITVSAKGIANGLSTEYNDGYDFGPDSYNPSVTSGVPLTQTSGIQEAWNYAVSVGVIYTYPLDSILSSTYTFIPEIKLLSGEFLISELILLSAPNGVYIENVKITGLTSMSPYIIVHNNNGFLKFDPNNFRYTNIEISNLQPVNANGYTPITFIDADFTSVSANNNVNVFQSYNLDFGGQPTNPMILKGFAQIIFYNYENYCSTGEILQTNGSVSYFGGVVSGNVSSPFKCGPTIIGPLTNVVFYGVSDIVYMNLQTLGSNATVAIYDSTIYDIVLTGDTNAIRIYNGVINSQHTLLSNSGTTPYTVNLFTVDNAVVVTDPLTYIGSDISVTHLDIKNIIDANNNPIPINDTTVSGTTAGSFVASQPNSEPKYKKVLIYLDGYENDTTTAQTYTFPVPFSTVAEITANTASVPVVSTSLTAFSVAPDTTTAYTGLIVIEGY